MQTAFEDMKADGVTVGLSHIHHPKYDEPAENGYFRLSRHFKWALDQVRRVYVYR